MFNLQNIFKGNVFCMQNIMWFIFVKTTQSVFRDEHILSKSVLCAKH